MIASFAAVTGLRWSTGNRKLAKTGDLLGTQVWSFNLPAFRSDDGFRVCPGSGACSTVCYAQQGWYNRDVVAGLREENLRILREAPDMVVLLRDLVAALPDGVGAIRLHDSGDFFSAAYLDAWLAAIRGNPARTFYAYTKSVPLVTRVVIPTNLSVVYSEGGRFDRLIPVGAPRSRIFADHRSREAAGWSDGNGIEADLPAIRGDKRVGLVYHGGPRDVGVLDQVPLFSEGP